MKVYVYSANGRLGTMVMVVAANSIKEVELCVKSVFAGSRYFKHWYTLPNEDNTQELSELSANVDKPQIITIQ